MDDLFDVLIYIYIFPVDAYYEPLASVVHDIYIYSYYCLI